MATLSEALGDTSHGDIKSRRIPVSRTSFTLTDRDAFDRAIDLSLDWLTKTAEVELPQEAGDRQAFEIPQASPKACGSVVRMDDDHGSVWAGRLEFFGDPVPTRVWITDLFVEHRRGGLARFGAQLTCETGPDDPGFDHSRPRIVREILESLAGEADGEALHESVVPVAVNEVADLASLIYRPNRRLPVVVISTDNGGGSQVDLAQLANRLSGAAHLRSLSIEPSFELSRTVGKQMSTFNGAVRIYMPGLEERAEDPFQHPLFLSPPSGWNPRLVGQLCSRILPLGFRDPDGEARFWRVGLLRQAASRAAAIETTGSREEILQAEIQALTDERDALRETADTAEALMYEANIKLLEAEADIERLEDEKLNLKSNLERKQSSESASLGEFSESDLRSLYEQEPTLKTSLKVIGSIFPNQVLILGSALASAQDSRLFSNKKKAFDLLWALATDYWGALASGESDATARKFFGSSYAARESETLSEAGRRRRTFMVDGAEVEMMKHLKIGVKDSKFETLRVHFEWFADRKLIVIGYCGGHLDF